MAIIEMRRRAVDALLQIGGVVYSRVAHHAGIEGGIIEPAINDGDARHFMHLAVSAGAAEETHCLDEIARNRACVGVAHCGRLEQTERVNVNHKRYRTPFSIDGEAANVA